MIQVLDDTNTSLTSHTHRAGGRSRRKSITQISGEQQQRWPAAIIHPSLAYVAHRADSEGSGHGSDGVTDADADDYDEDSKQNLSRFGSRQDTYGSPQKERVDAIKSIHFGRGGGGGGGGG